MIRRFVTTAIGLSFAALAFAQVPGPRPSPNKPRPIPHGPWENDLNIQISKDGTTFSPAAVFVERAGVPTVAREKSGRLVAAFQWFPDDDTANFDRVAVKFSKDNGKTWTAPEPIAIAQMPAKFQRAFDPTLVPLEDGRLRLYFTSNPGGTRFVGEHTGTYSAVSSDGINYTFEPEARFEDPGKPVLDCAVVRFGGKFHYFAPIQGPDGGAYHATAEDGLKFTREADLKSVGRTRWLGCAVANEDSMQFFGTSPDGVWKASSKDGLTWTQPAAIGVRGADPAVVVAADGSLVVITTGEPQEGREPTRPDLRPKERQRSQ